MDTLDVLIFCEMSFKYFDYPGKQRRASPKAIGAKLGIDERTVRLRTRKMEKQGFIQYYQAIPNLRLFDHPLAFLCNFRSPSLALKPRILESIRREDDILDIADFLGDGFGVTVSVGSEPEARERAHELAERVGVPEPHVMPPRQFPTLEKFPSKLDWELLRALRYDAQRPARIIAKELRITERMAEYGIRRLFESKAVSTRAIINARDPKGILFYSVNLAVDQEKQTQVVRELKMLFGERAWWIVNPPGQDIILFLFASSIGRVEDDLLEGLSKPGVTSGSITIFKGWVEPVKPSWIDRALDEKILAQERQLSNDN